MPRDSSAPAPPPLTEYAAQMLKQRLERMLSHGEGVKEGQTTAPVHQMRVWSRRTRAALEVFHLCFNSRTFNEMEREIKRMAEALGTARDLDVMVETVSGLSDRIPEAQRAGVSGLIESLKEDRNSYQSEVSRAAMRLQRFDFASVIAALDVQMHPELPVHAELAGRMG